MEPQTQQILGVITAILVLILVAPNIFRLNIALGSTVRNIALWLFIFVALVWAYNFFHPNAVPPAPATVATEPAPDDVPQSGPEADNSTRF
jgi:hypothetical protein